MSDSSSSNPLVSELREVAAEPWKHDGGVWPDIMRNAADEIERLTARVASHEQTMEGDADRIRVLLAELAVRDSILSERNAALSKIEAERDRLAAELEALKHDVDRYIAISSQEATESSRLRAALETIASGHTVAFPAHIARDALAGEDRPKDRPEVNAAYPIGYSESHAKRSADETVETAPNADKVSVSRLSDETFDGPTVMRPYPYTICNTTSPEKCERSPDGYCAKCHVSMLP